MVRGYKNTCLNIIKDKVNKDNIDLVLSEIDDFTRPYKSNDSENKVFDDVMDILNKIKNQR